MDQKGKNISRKIKIFNFSNMTTPKIFSVLILGLLLLFCFEKSEAQTNYGLSFDGTNDYVSLPNALWNSNFSNGTAITVEYWFKGTLMNSVYRVQTTSYFVAGYYGHNHLISTSPSSPTWGPYATILDGITWHHLAVTWSRNGKFTSYVDGSQYDQTNAADANLPAIDFMNCLGAYSGTSEFLNGSLDDVRIWNVVRSATEISDNKNKELNGNETGLVAYYKMNEGSGTALSDLTGHGYNGTLQNGVSWTSGTSSIILGPTITTTGSLSAFSAPLGTASAVQNFSVSGTALTNDITITAPTGFEISTTSGSGYGSTLILTQASGIVASTTIYVRMAASATGTPSGNITLVSAVANTQNVAASGSVYVAPTTQAYSVYCSPVAGSQLTINWTNGNGTKRAVFVKAGSGTITNPTDNTTYTASAGWNSKGTQLGTSGYYCVYNGTSNWVNLTGLNGSTPYTMQVFEYNGEAGLERYNVTTASNNPSSQTTYNYALWFNGSNGTVTLPAMPSCNFGTGDFTVEWWQNQTDNSSWTRIFYGTGLEVSIEGGTFFAWIGGNAVNCGSAGTYKNTWVHFAVTRSGGTVTVYKNGEVFFSFANTASANAGSGPIYLGSMNGSSGTFFGGRLDEFRIWSTTRTQAQIQNNMYNELNGNEAGLAGYYKMSDGSGTYLTDNTGRGYGGSLNGGVGWDLGNPAVVNDPTITTTGTLSPFVTGSGTASSAQNFSASGRMLSGDITVIPLTGFEVSTSLGSGYASSLTLTQIEGGVSNTILYVRLAASATGTPSGNITLTSPGVTSKNVAATGTVYTVPSTQASNIVFSNIGNNQMTIGWTNGNGSNRAVFVKLVGGAITNPTDNTLYTGSTDWNSKGTQLGSSGYYCVYNGTGNSVTLTGLEYGNQYTVQVFEYSGTLPVVLYQTATALKNPRAIFTNRSETIDFNHNTDTPELNYYFVPDGDVHTSNIGSGGIGNSGSVANGFTGYTDLWTKGGEIPFTSGRTYSASAYFYNTSNNGYCGLGYSADQTNTSGYLYPNVGLGTANHASGGFFANNTVMTDQGAGFILTASQWYYVVFSMTNTGGNMFDLKTQIYNSDPNGTVYTLVTEKTQTGVSNTQMANAAVVYAYFSLNDNRFTNMDNFNVSYPFFPRLTTNGTINPFAACSGTVSESQYITVRGENLFDNEIVTAPDGFEVSTSSGSGYASSITFEPISSKTVYVRMSASATGTPSGNIAITSTDAATVNVAVSGVLTANAAITSQTTATQTQCSGGTFTPITVTATGPKVTYQWYSNTDSSNSGGSTLGSENGARTNSYTPQASVVGTLYYYCIVGSDCASKSSAISGAFIVSTCAPDAPVSLVATPGNGIASISFTAGSDNSFSITNYEYSTDNGVIFTACSPVVTASLVPISGLTNGLTYQVKLRAVNSRGSGAASSAISVTPRTTPGTPTALSATPSDHGASITFTPPADNGGSAVTNYQYSVNNGTSWTACSPAVTNSPVTITGLSNQTTFQVKLRAVNAAGTGTASVAVSVITPAGTPGNPISLSAVVGTNKASIYFTAPSNNGGSAITNYQYSINDGSSWTSFSPETTISPVVITGLTNSTTYLVRLRAVNSAGSGTPSGSISVKPVATITWVGGHSGNINAWSEPLNWDGGTVPGPADIVVIPNVSSKPEGNTLSVDAGGKLTINPNGSVSLTGTSTNNGSIIIKSDANGTGSLIASATFSGSGNALVERYMSENAWHIISSPTGNQSIKAFIDDNLDIPVVSGASPVQYGMMDYDPVKDLWNPYFTDTTTRALGLGKGYMVRVQDPVEVLRFKGIINATATVAVVKGWNCIGNPFTSAVNINALAGTDNFITANTSAFESVNGGLYFWDQSSGQGQYMVVNNASASYKAAVGQGFFMKVKDEVPTVLFTPAMQVHQYDAPFKAAQSEYPSIKLTANSGTNSFYTEIKFIDGTTKGLDFGYDAGLFTTDKSFALYTKLVDDNGVEFQLQCLPPTGYEKMIIPVGIDSKTAGEIVFTVQTVQLEAGCKVILEDKLTNTFTDLSKVSYKAVVSANTAGAGRFYLHTGDIVSGIEDQVLQGKITAYARGNNEIRVIGEVSDGAAATLVNGLGKVVLTKILGARNLNIIGLPNLSSGVYLLNIDDKGTSQTIKVMIR